MIKVITLTTEIVACPMRLTGFTDDGRKVSVNYRWGYLTIYIADDNEDGWEFGQQVGGENDGWLDLDEIRKLTDCAVEWPDEVSDPPARSNDDALDLTDLSNL